MASSKYGRLFTEDDVLKMLEQAHDSGFDIGSGTAEDNLGPVPRDFIDQADREGAITFPADEPLFLLRGKDLAAHGGAWGYAYEAQRVGASIEFVTAALGCANDLRDWAEQHRDRMKIPD